MTLTLRSEKGAPLTIEELDNNFRELSARLEHLEAGNFAIESLKEVTIEGGELVFTSSFGREVGRCPLPVPSLHARGRWRKNTDYCPGQTVTLKEKAFLCKVAHTSQRSFEHDQDKWQLFLEHVPQAAQSGCFPQKTRGLPSKMRASDPPPHSSWGSLPLYEKNTLPEPLLGKIGVLIENNKEPQIVFGTGRKWKKIFKKNFTPQTSKLRPSSLTMEQDNAHTDQKKSAQTRT